MTTPGPDDLAYHEQVAREVVTLAMNGDRAQVAKIVRAHPHPTVLALCLVDLAAIINEAWGVGMSYVLEQEVDTAEAYRMICLDIAAFTDAQSTKGETP